MTLWKGTWRIPVEHKKKLEEISDEQEKSENELVREAFEMLIAKYE